MAHEIDPKQTTRAFAYEFWMKYDFRLVHRITFAQTVSNS